MFADVAEHIDRLPSLRVMLNVKREDVAESDMSFPDGFIYPRILQMRREG